MYGYVECGHVRKLVKRRNLKFRDIVSSNLTMPTKYRNHIIIGYSGPEYWRWFDLMPRRVREQLNNAKDRFECLDIWAQACEDNWREIEREINGN